MVVTRAGRNGAHVRSRVVEVFEPEREPVPILNPNMAEKHAPNKILETKLNRRNVAPINALVSFKRFFRKLDILKKLIFQIF